MNKTTLISALLLSALTMLTSCLGDDDDNITYYDDTAITSFTLGTLKYYATTTSSTGADSTYQTTYDASGYHFYIDQLSHEIYNPDSLPKQVDASKIIATVTSKNSGIVTIKSLTSDSLSYYSSSDSIDFTQPRTFRVYNLSGTAYTDYTVRVNVHQQDSTTFSWTNVATTTPFTDATALRSVAVNDTLWTFASDGSATTAWYTTDGSAWTEFGTSFSADAYQNIAALDGKLYVLSDSKIYTIEGLQTSTADATGITRLAAASHKGAYGLTSSGISLFDGSAWTAETLGDESSLLPTSWTAFSCLPTLSNDSTDAVFFAGVNSTTGKIATWEKTDEYKTSAHSQSWYYILPKTTYQLPVLDQLTLLDYDNATLAFGVDADTLTTFYQSEDKGLTWHSFSDYSLPDDVSSATVFGAAVDSNNYIWFVTPTAVWRGRLDRLGWTTGQTEFR